MIGYNTLLTGDPLYMFNVTLATGGICNYSRYSNPQVDTLLDQLRTEADPARHEALSRQIQEHFREDTPYVTLLSPPQVAAFRKGKVQGYIPHPNDIYLLNPEIAVK